MEWGFKVIHKYLFEMVSAKWNDCWIGVRCSPMIRAFAHGAMGRQIGPSWWTHWAISHSNQCSTTAVTKAWYVLSFVCGMVHIKESLLLISPCSGGSRFPLSLSEWYFTICPNHYITVFKMCWVHCKIKHFLPWLLNKTILFTFY